MLRIFTEAETVTEADFLETAQIERATLADPYTLERDTAIWSREPIILLLL